MLVQQVIEIKFIKAKAERNKRVFAATIWAPSIWFTNMKRLLYVLSEKIRRSFFLSSATFAHLEKNPRYFELQKEVTN